MKIWPPLADPVAPVADGLDAGAPTDPVEAEESDGLGVPAEGVPFASMLVGLEVVIDAALC